MSTESYYNDYQKYFANYPLKSKASFKIKGKIELDINSQIFVVYVEGGTKIFKI